MNILSIMKVYGVKARKSEVKDTTIVPFHPEFVFAKAVDENSWHATNTQTGEMVRVRKEENGDFFEYEVEEV